MRRNYGICNYSRTSRKWHISQRRVSIYCKEGRVEAAVIKGKTWMIPADVEKPKDPRRLKKKMNEE